MQKATGHETFNPQILKEHENIKVLKDLIKKGSHDKKTAAFQDEDEDAYCGDEVIQ